MKLSIIVPIYNSESFMENCVRNIEDVGLENYELILVDDGSTDNSGIICDGFAEVNEHILCVHQQNQGVSVARNHGLEEASGDYVLFMDVDDSIDSQQLNKLLHQLGNESEIDMAIFGLSFDYYYNGKLYRRDMLETPMLGIYEKDEWRQKLFELYYANSLSPIWNKIIRRNFLIENKLYFRQDMFVCEDLEFSIRCMCCCKRVFFEKIVIYHYRQSEDEGNAGRRLKRIEHIPYVINQIEDAFKIYEGEGVLENQRDEIKKIVLELYLGLVREKITVSNKKEIKIICDDFSKWYYANAYIKPTDVLVSKLLNHNVCGLVIKCRYTAIRHKIAIIVKNTAIYQKMGRLI